MTDRPIRIGSGAGYAGDRWEPALELVEKGEIDFLAFECLAERTIAREALSRRNRQSDGYNPLLAERIRSVLAAARKRGVRIISNMGAANPEAAAEVVVEIARTEGLTGTKVAAVLGDDVLSWVLARPDAVFLETGERVASVLPDIVSANAYLGADAIAQALGTGADVVITGRVADPALFLAPVLATYGWAADDPRLGQGTVMGHLLECAGQITGGYFADPGKKEVPEPWALGFPYADVWADGRVRIGKVEGTGGRIDRMTCTEQLLYEMHDPAAYLTPDCVLDVTDIAFEEHGADLVEVAGARAGPRPDTLKVSVGYLEGFIGEGQISYAGINAIGRARLAGEIVSKRLERRGYRYDDLRVELIGIESLHGPERAEEPKRAEPYEVRLRVAGRTPDRGAAVVVGQEVETLLTNGPAGGAGEAKAVREILRVQSVLIPRSDIHVEVKVFEA